MMAAAAPHKSSTKIRRFLVGVVLLLVGIFIGVVVNWYGLLMSKVTIELSVSIKDLPTELQNQSRAAILDRVRRGALNHSFFVVPNIVHFIWFGEGREMSFLNYISILSAKKLQKPETIMLHYDHLPKGHWWERLKKDVNMQLVYKAVPRTIHNQTLWHTFHKGDVAKIEILEKYGGIYLDYDVIVLQSLDPFRHFDMTLGKEKPPKFIAGIIIARKNALFLKIWYESYRNNYRPLDWDYNCARVTYQLYLKRPDLLHVEPYRFTTPDWQDRDLLWKQTIDWSELYVIHVMNHFSWDSYDPERIKTLDSTLGEVMRYIYYGSAKKRTT